MKPPNFKSKSCILGKGNGILLVLLLSSLKSEMKQTFSFFLGIINVGTAYSELFSCFKAPMFTNLLTSFLRVYLCTFGIGNGFACCYWAPTQYQYNILMYHQTCIHVSSIAYNKNCSSQFKYFNLVVISFKCACFIFGI